MKKTRIRKKGRLWRHDVRLVLFDLQYSIKITQNLLEITTFFHSINLPRSKPLPRSSSCFGDIFSSLLLNFSIREKGNNLIMAENASFVLFRFFFPRMLNSETTSECIHQNTNEWIVFFFLVGYTFHLKCF